MMQNVHRMGSEERPKGVNKRLGKLDAAKGYSKDGFFVDKKKKLTFEKKNLPKVLSP